MGYKLNNFKPVIASLLAILMVVSGFPLTTISFSASNDLKTVKIEHIFSEKFSSSSTKKVSKNISSYIPSGYQVQGFEVIKQASDGRGDLKEVNQGKYGGSVYNNVITIPSFNGVEVEVKNVGFTSDMYFGVVRAHNGKQWQITSGRAGTVYTVSPSSNDSCWSGGIAVCPGKLTKDINGNTLPSDIKDSNGWGVMISDGFAGPTKYLYNDSEIVYTNQLKSNSVKISNVHPSVDNVKAKFSVTNNKADLTVYVDMSRNNRNYVPNPYGSNYGTVYRYDVSTRTDWSAKTYLYDADIILSLEPIPPKDEPYVSCDCKANPSSIEFANADVKVITTLTATVKNNESRTVKNWTVYGRGNDNSQLVTKTNVGTGQSTITTTFNFTISKDKLAAVDSYTETWAMRARVYFTNGTTAEQAIECTTTVYKPGTATPEPSPSDDPDDPEPTPEPTPEPPRIAVADIAFEPDWIIAGEKSSLRNYSEKYDDYEWEFSDNLVEVIPDTDERQFNDVEFDKPGTYKATINVWNDRGSEDSASATLEVVDPKPVAVVTGPVKVIQGREIPFLHHLQNSYTPLESRGESIDFTRSEYRYKNIEDSTYITGWPTKGPDKIGTYSIEGKVYDTTGRVSDWGTLQLEVVPDQAPTVSLITPESAYRNSEQTIFLDGESPDGDKLVQLVVQERYDDDDDGNFDEEPWTNFYSGAYKSTLPVKYTTVGSHQYRAQVTEDYGLSSDWSELDETEILNYAPEVDFDAYGLTTQPGENSLPPSTTLTPFSVFNSWKLKTQYTGGDASKLAWKTDSTYLGTKNAQYPNYYVDYPNTGLGPNSRSVNDLASDLHAVTPWLVPDGETPHPQVFGVNRIYSYISNSSGSTVNERNSVTGELLRTFSIPGAISLIDPKEQFYSVTKDASTKTMTFKVFNNEGQQVDSLDMRYGSNITSDDISIQILDYKFTENNSILTLSLSYSVDHLHLYMYQIRYSIASRSIVWEIPLSTNFYDEDYTLNNVKMTVGTDGTIYTTFRKDYIYEAYLGESYLAWVTPDGIKRTITLKDTDGASYPVVSDDGKYIYVNTMRLTSRDRDHYLCTINTSTESTSYSSLGQDAKSWSSEWLEQIINPIVLPDGNVLSVDLFNKEGDLIQNYKDVLNFQVLFGNVFVDSAGREIIPHADFYYTSGKINTYIDIYQNGTKIKSYTNPFISAWGYTEENAPKDYFGVESYSGSSTSILPDGSIYIFSHGAVIPYVSTAASGDYPKAVDNNTIEVINDNWGGLWYDKNTIMKNDSISINVRIDNSTKNNKTVGAGIHIQDEKNMYSAEWTDTTLTLYKVVSGTKTVLKSTTMNRLPGTNYAFKFEAINGSLRVYINNIERLEASDSTYLSGAAGIMALGQSDAKFSNVVLTNIGDSYIEETPQTVLVNEGIKYETIFSDIESDPKNAEKWTYNHDPNYFANPEGTSQFNGKSYSDALVSLDKPGLFNITYQAQDNPGMVAYQMWSEPVTKELYVHRRPIAAPDVRFTSKVYAGGEALDYDTYDASYDPDVPDYLAERKFRYRWADSSTWTDGKQQLYNRPGVELIVQEQVRDLHGAWSYWAETRVYKDALPPINQTKPVMTITVPSGTLAAPSIYKTDPTLNWTYYDAEGDPQEQFYLKLTYVDTGEKIMEVTYPGNDTSFILEEGTVELGRKVKVQGRVYSNGAWSADSNITYFVLNTPPSTQLVTMNGPDQDHPIYTNIKTPALKVKVMDGENQTPQYIDYEVFYSTGEQVIDTNAATGSTSYTPAPLREGLHIWRAKANDSMAWGGYSENGYFFVDTVRPDDKGEQLDVQPTSVTVTFNPFSDATPSSGHASRAFYMQKVNYDGSVTPIDLNGNGTAEESITLANYKTSYTVNGLITGQRYRLMVVDWDRAGNMGYYEYIYFITNRQPVADFDWSPKPVFEGDDIQIINHSEDPDGDDMRYTWTISGPDGYNNIFTTKDVTLPGSVTENHPGDYIVRLHVEDEHGLADETEPVKTIMVLPLGITAAVMHTDDWDQNRLKWNDKMPDNQRSSSTFWAGERFVLNAGTTDTGDSLTKAESVKVTVAKIGRTSLGSDDKIAWEGYIGNENADVKLEKLADGAYVFNFKATYTNGVVKETDVTITIKGNWTEYFRFHKNW